MISATLGQEVASKLNLALKKYIYVFGDDGIHELDHLLPVHHI